MPSVNTSYTPDSLLPVMWSHPSPSWRTLYITRNSMHWSGSWFCCHPLPVPYKPLPQTHWFYRVTPKPAQAGVQSAARPQGVTGCGRPASSVSVTTLRSTHANSTDAAENFKRQIIGAKNENHFTFAFHFFFTDSTFWTFLPVGRCEYLTATFTHTCT